MQKKRGVPIFLTVSGMPKLLKGSIINKDEVQVELPIKKTLEELIEEKEGFTLIKIDGILMVIPNEKFANSYLAKLKENEAKTKQEIKIWTQKNIQTKEKAIGVMLFEKEKDAIKINPLVWVKDIDTMFYETACGSGSLAAAIWMFSKFQQKKTKVVQPSGYTITVELKMKNDEMKKAVVSGMVKEGAL